jgi:small conductance mechanosensitive channel
MSGSEGFNVQKTLDTLSELVSIWGVRVLLALVVLVVGLTAAKWLRATVRKSLARAKVDETLTPFLSSMVYYLAVTLVVVAVLGQFGVQTTSFIAVLGAGAFAIGLALQGTLGNFSAGVMILVFRPFKVGDFIDAGGTSGSVQEILLFSTVLHSPDNVRIIVPNGQVYGQTIKNFSFNDNRRNDLVVGVSYDDDLNKAHEVIERVVRNDPRVLSDPAPTIAVSELADSSVNFVVRPWCKKEDYWPLRFDLTQALKEQLEAAGCSIPYPQQDVHMHSAGAA